MVRARFCLRVMPNFAPLPTLRVLHQAKDKLLAHSMTKTAQQDTALHADMRPAPMGRACTHKTQIGGPLFGQIGRYLLTLRLAGCGPGADIQPAYKRIARGSLSFDPRRLN